MPADKSSKPKETTQDGASSSSEPSALVIRGAGALLAMKCPISTFEMVDPVLCDDYEVYDRFEVIKALIADPAGFPGVKGRVTKILAHATRLKEIIHDVYKDKKVKCERLRKRFREEIENAMKDGDFKFALERLKFLKDFDSTPIPGEEKLEAVMSEVDNINKLLRETHDEDKEDKSEELAQSLFQFIELAHENNCVTLARLLLRAQEEIEWDEDDEWFVEARVGLMIVDSMAHRQNDTRLFGQSSDLTEFVASSCFLPTQKRQLLRHLLWVLRTRTNGYSFNDKYLMVLHLWLFYKDDPALKDIATQTFEYFRDNPKAQHVDLNTSTELIREARKKDNRCQVLMDRLMHSQGELKAQLNMIWKYMDERKPSSISAPSAPGVATKIASAPASVAKVTPLRLDPAAAKTAPVTAPPAKAAASSAAAKTVAKKTAAAPAAAKATPNRQRAAVVHARSAIRATRSRASSSHDATGEQENPRASKKQRLSTNN